MPDYRRAFSFEDEHARSDISAQKIKCRLDRTSLFLIMGQTISGEKDPQILVQIREFLNGLNNSRGKPMEEMTPEEARQVLVGAQKSVEVITSVTETARESHKMVSR